jgi:hypothetical protein
VIQLCSHDERLPLAHCLSTNTRITSIQLVGLNLKDDFVIPLANALAHNQYVTSVDLTSNGMRHMTSLFLTHSILSSFI